MTTYRIRELEWKCPATAHLLLIAEVVDGGPVYAVDTEFCTLYQSHPETTTVTVAESGDLDQAKAAAQSHFEQSLMGALERVE